MKRWRSPSTSESIPDTRTRWCAASFRCLTAPARPCASPFSPRRTRLGGAGRRRRYRRCRRPDGAGAKGSDRLRPLHRYAGYDGTRREAGQDTGAAQTMPNPKVGTVTMDVGGAVKAAKAGQVEFRVGPASSRYRQGQLRGRRARGNFRAFVDAVVKAKPTGAKEHMSSGSASARPWDPVCG